MRSAEIVRLRCRSAAPRDRSDTGTCDHVIGDILGPVQFVGLRARRPDQLDGRVWVQCPHRKCRTWNIFELAQDG